jgi:hypothetical protein
MNCTGELEASEHGHADAAPRVTVPLVHTAGPPRPPRRRPRPEVALDVRPLWRPAPWHLDPRLRPRQARAGVPRHRGALSLIARARCGSRPPRPIRRSAGSDAYSPTARTICSCSGAPTAVARSPRRRRGCTRRPARCRRERDCSLVRGRGSRDYTPRRTHDTASRVRPAPPGVGPPLVRLARSPRLSQLSVTPRRSLRFCCVS